MDELPTYSCPRVRIAPRLDGRLDDEVWQSAPAAGPFILANGAGPAERQTTARAGWGDTHLYVAFDCVDPDIWNDFTQRDDPVYTQEVVEVFITPHSTDLRVHFAFELSPRNVLWDSRHVLTDDGPSRGERDWNCAGVATATAVRGTLDNRVDVDEGWSAELAIPFAGLGVATPRAGDVWRVNFFRIDRTPLPEFSCWSPTLNDPPAFHTPARFGRLAFGE